MTHPFYKKQRLPRRLKKASRHVDFEVCDMQPMADVSADEKDVTVRLDVDYRVRMRPAGYPRTRQVQRLVALFLRKLGQAHRRAVSDMLRRQYLEQHPGMLTYGDSPHPAPPEVTEPGFVVMSREQIRRIAEQVRTDRLWPTSETARQMRRDDIRLVSCHDCPHWQDADEGPQCEHPDCPPCNGN